MAVLGNLVVRIGADTRQLAKGLTVAQRSISKAGKAIDTAMQPIRKIGDSFKKVGMIAGVVAGALGFVTSKAANSADELDAMSKKTGLSVERLQELRYISDQVGTSFEAIQAGASRFTIAMRQATKGATAQTEIFDALQVSLYNQDGSLRATGDAYMDTIKALADVSDQTQQAFYASELFGRSYAEMLPLLQEGAAGIDELAQRAHELGLVVSGEDISALAELNDRIGELKMKFEAIGTKIAVAFLPLANVVIPILMDFANAIVFVTGRIGSLVSNMFGVQAKAADTGSDLAKAQKQVAGGYTAAGKAAKGALASFDEVNSMQEQASEGASGADLGSDDVEGAGLFAGIGKAMEDATAPVTKITDAVKWFFATVEEKGQIIAPVLAAVGAAFVSWKLFETLAGLPMFILNVAKAVGAMNAAIVANPVAALIAVLAGLAIVFVTAYKTNDEFRARVDSLASKIGDFLRPVLEKVGAVLQWLWQEVILPLAAVFNDVFAIALGVVIGVLESLWKNVLVPIGNLLATVFLAAVQGIVDIFNAVLRPAIERQIEVLTFLWHHVLEPIAQFLAGLFTTAFDTVFTHIGEAIGGIKQVFLGLINFITGIFTGDWRRAWEGVKSVFKGIWDTLGAVIKTPLNLIIDAINAVIKGLNKLSVNIPSWVPVLGGQTWGVNISEIPHFERGGIIDEPTNLIAGEHGKKEAIVPLEDTGFVQAIGDAVASGVATAMAQVMQVTGTGGQSPRELIINLDGAQMARAIIPSLDKERSRIGSTAVIQTV